MRQSARRTNRGVVKILSGLYQTDLSRRQTYQPARLLRGKRGEATAATVAAARTDETLKTALQL